MPRTVPLSIVVPVYNYAHYLERVFLSLAKQADRSFEAVFVNDGSKDESLDVLHRLCEKYTFRTCVIDQENHGRGVACQRGAEIAQGEFVLFLDADDALTENAVQDFVLAMQHHPRVDAIFANHETYFEDGTTKRSCNPPMHEEGYVNAREYLFKKRYSLSNGSYVIRRESFLRFPYDPELRISEDVPFKTHVLANLNCMTISPVVLRVYRHPGSMRTNSAIYLEQFDLLIDKIFDPTKLGGALLNYKDLYRERARLSLFRTLYKAKEYSTATKLYWSTLKKNPHFIFKWAYFSKFIRAALHVFLKKRLPI